MKDLERVKAALKQSFPYLGGVDVALMAKVAIHAMEKQDQETAAVVNQAAQCSRMMLIGARPRTCAKCGLGPCGNGLGHYGQQLHVQQPIAGMAPNDPISELHLKPALDEHTKAAIDKLREEHDADRRRKEQAYMKPGPGVFAPAAEEQAMPVRWEVIFVDCFTGTLDIPAVWEPFGVGGGNVWLRRRVP